MNIGGFEDYLAQPNEQRVNLATVDQTTWGVTITEIKTKSGSKLNEGAPVVARFDTTSKYIHVPRVEAADPNSTPFLYFMNSNDLLCFNPNTNVANTLSFICPSDKFGSLSDYSAITFSF